MTLFALIITSAKFQLKLLIGKLLTLIISGNELPCTWSLALFSMVKIGHGRVFSINGHKENLPQSQRTPRKISQYLNYLVYNWTVNTKITKDYEQF